MSQASSKEIAGWFQKAFKLFGVGHSVQGVDEFDGFVDGVLLLPVRRVSRDGVLLQSKKMTLHFSNDQRANLSQTHQQRRKRRAK